MLLLTQQDWRNSLNRFAEAMTLFAATCAVMYPVLHLGRPFYFYFMIPYPSMLQVWPQFRSPLVWDLFAFFAYLTVSLIFWYVGLVPDLASVRDRTRKRRWQVFFGVAGAGLARRGGGLGALAADLCPAGGAGDAAGGLGAFRRVAAVRGGDRCPAGTPRSSRPISCWAPCSQASRWWS